MFKITSNKGFHLTFENGYTLSVQFGPGNYCENYNQNIFGNDDKKFSSPDAEIAVWDRNYTWRTRDFLPDLNDDVAGRLSVDDVADLIEKIRSAK